MAKLTILTDREPLVVPVEEGTLLSEALQRHGHAPEMPCGGKGRCRKCRVRAQGALSQPSKAELDALTEQEMAEGVRLACCAGIQGDVQVRLESSKAVSRICVEGVEGEFVPDPLYYQLGAAVDIGTTTLAAQLYGPEGLLGSAAAPNPQRSFGADVISRVGRSMSGDAPALASCVREGVAGLLRQMAAQAGRTPEEIDYVVITGNTAMLHLFAGEDASPLAAAPFQPKELFGKTMDAAALDLPCAANAKAYLTRCMSAFVGGDITTALLASGICRRQETAMLADIGTNGEIALWHQGRLSCCSTAAGPAFEGANISQGMQGAPGAIDHAWVRGGELLLHTIGDVPAVGICGSGVADVLAALLLMGKVDETGLLDDGEDAWPLTDRVSLPQEDVRQVQLAKSAVCAGIETLLDHGQLAAEDIRELAVAGGFGSYLDLRSAAAIGLIPAALAARAKVLGNAALSGAAMILQSGGLAAESEALAARAETVDLSTSPVFMDQYIEHMMFSL